VVDIRAQNGKYKTLSDFFKKSGKILKIASIRKFFGVLILDPSKFILSPSPSL